MYSTTDYFTQKNCYYILTATLQAPSFPSSFVQLT